MIDIIKGNDEVEVFDVLESDGVISDYNIVNEEYLYYKRTKLFKILNKTDKFFLVPYQNDKPEYLVYRSSVYYREHLIEYNDDDELWKRKMLNIGSNKYLMIEYEKCYQLIYKNKVIMKKIMKNVYGEVKFENSNDFLFGFNNLGISMFAFYKNQIVDDFDYKVSSGDFNHISIGEYFYNDYDGKNILLLYKNKRIRIDDDVTPGLKYEPFPFQTRVLRFSSADYYNAGKFDYSKKSLFVHGDKVMYYCINDHQSFNEVVIDYAKSLSHSYADSIVSIYNNMMNNILWDVKRNHLFCREYKDFTMLIFLIWRFIDSDDVSFCSIPKDVLMYHIIPYIPEIDVFIAFNDWFRVCHNYDLYRNDFKKYEKKLSLYSKSSSIYDILETLLIVRRLTNFESFSIVERSEIDSLSNNIQNIFCEIVLNQDFFMKGKYDNEKDHQEIVLKLSANIFKILENILVKYEDIEFNERFLDVLFKRLLIELSETFQFLLLLSEKRDLLPYLKDFINVFRQEKFFSDDYSQQYDCNVFNALIIIKNVLLKNDDYKKDIDLLNAIIENVSKIDVEKCDDFKTMVLRFEIFSYVIGISCNLNIKILELNVHILDYFFDKIHKDIVKVHYISERFLTVVKLLVYSPKGLFRKYFNLKYFNFVKTLIDCIYYYYHYKCNYDVSYLDHFKKLHWLLSEYYGLAESFKYELLMSSGVVFVAHYLYSLRAFQYLLRDESSEAALSFITLRAIILLALDSVFKDDSINSNNKGVIEEITRNWIKRIRKDLKFEMVISIPISEKLLLILRKFKINPIFEMKIRNILQYSKLVKIVADNDDIPFNNNDEQYFKLQLSNNDALVQCKAVLDLKCSNLVKDGTKSNEMVSLLCNIDQDVLTMLNRDVTLLLRSFIDYKSITLDIFNVIMNLEEIDATEMLKEIINHEKNSILMALEFFKKYNKKKGVFKNLLNYWLVNHSYHQTEIIDKLFNDGCKIVYSSEFVCDESLLEFLNNIYDVLYKEQLLTYERFDVLLFNISKFNFHNADLNNSKLCNGIKQFILEKLLVNEDYLKRKFNFRSKYKIIDTKDSLRNIFLALSRTFSLDRIELFYIWFFDNIHDKYLSADGNELKISILDLEQIKKDLNVMFISQKDEKVSDAIFIIIERIVSKYLVNDEDFIVSLIDQFYEEKLKCPQNRMSSCYDRLFRYLKSLLNVSKSFPNYYDDSSKIFREDVLLMDRICDLQEIIISQAYYQFEDEESLSNILNEIFGYIEKTNSNLKEENLDNYLVSKSISKVRAVYQNYSSKKYENAKIEDHISQILLLKDNDHIKYIIEILGLLLYFNDIKDDNQFLFTSYKKFLFSILKEMVLSFNNDKNNEKPFKQMILNEILEFFNCLDFGLLVEGINSVGVLNLLFGCFSFKFILNQTKSHSILLKIFNEVQLSSFKMKWEKLLALAIKNYHSFISEMEHSYELLFLYFQMIMKIMKLVDDIEIFKERKFLKIFRISRFLLSNSEDQKTNVMISERIFDIMIELSRIITSSKTEYLYTLKRMNIDYLSEFLINSKYHKKFSEAELQNVLKVFCNESRICDIIGTGTTKFPSISNENLFDHQFGISESYDVILPKVDSKSDLLFNLDGNVTNNSESIQPEVTDNSKIDFYQDPFVFNDNQPKNTDSSKDIFSFNDKEQSQEFSFPNSNNDMFTFNSPLNDNHKDGKNNEFTFNGNNEDKHKDNGNDVFHF